MPNLNDQFADEAAWLLYVRKMHRWKRLAGILGCLAGALLMLLGKFKPGSYPGWFMAAGLGIAIASWLVFAWVGYDRFRWVKAHPFKAAVRR